MKLRWMIILCEFPSGKSSILKIFFFGPITLPQTNMAPETGWLEDQFPFGMAYFQGRLPLVSGSVFMPPGRYNLPSEYIRNSVLILLSSQAVVRQNTVHTSSYAARFEVCKPGIFFLLLDRK